MMMHQGRRVGSVTYSSSSSDDDISRIAPADSVNRVQQPPPLDAVRVGAAKGDAEFRRGDQVLFLPQALAPPDGSAGAAWELGRVLELQSSATDGSQSTGFDGMDKTDVIVIQGLTGRDSGDQPISTTRQYVRRYSYEGSSFDVNDLSTLPEPNDAALLYTLRQRYFQGLHYTYIGRMLLALNPYQRLAYPSHAPHPKRVAEAVREALHIPSSGCGRKSNSYYFGSFNCNGNDDKGMGNTIDPTGAIAVPRKPVALIVTGDSGAGKTETTKQVLLHLLGCPTLDATGSIAPHNVCGDDKNGDDDDDDDAATRESALRRIARVLDAANCLLESFGNASTLLNNNSSRFAKWMTVLLDSCTGVVVGVEVRCYLLETSRLASRSVGDSTFHVFGTLFDEQHGLTPDERMRFDVWDPALFRVMRSGNGGAYFNLSTSPYTLSQVRLALQSLGLGITEIGGIIRILCGILHLLNIEFTSASLFTSASVAPGSISACEKAEELLGFSSTGVRTSLGALLTTLRLGKDVRQLHVAAADAVRDSVASHMYESLFRYIVRAINEAVAPACAEPGKEYVRFSILDIFGFEVKDERSGKNDLEQLLINYANEALQRLYEETTFEHLQAEAAREGVQLDIPTAGERERNMTYELLVRRPHGVLNTIDDDTLLAQRSRQEGGANLSALLVSLKDAFPGLIKPHRAGPTKVFIQHYCATVVYDTENMSVKNRVSTAAAAICAGSTDAFVSEICNALSLGSTTHLKKQRHHQQQGGELSLLEDENTNVLAPRLHATTLIAQFRAQMEVLTLHLKASELFWIRCIKPNNNASSQEFDSALVFSQLKYAAVLRSFMLFGSGYCHKFTYQSFVQGYLLLAVRGYSCDVSYHGKSPKRDPYHYGSREANLELALGSSSSVQSRAQRVAPILTAVYRARFRKACLLATQLVPCCMNGALLLGASNVFMCSDTLRLLLALGDLAKSDAAHRIQRVARAFMQRRLLFAAQLSRVREARLAAIRERIANEMPEREALEKDREALLLQFSESRAEHLAFLSRRAMKSFKSVERRLKETMEILSSELTRGLGEIDSYEAARCKREKEVWDEAAMEELYRAQARESTERERRRQVEVTRRHQRETTQRRGLQLGTRTARRSRSDMDAEREEAIRKEIIKARQLQLKVEQEMMMERRQRAEQVMERMEARQVRIHLEKQQRRMLERFRMKGEVEQRRSVSQSMYTRAHSVPHTDSLRDEASDRANNVVDGTIRDHREGLLMAPPPFSATRAASHDLFSHPAQKAERASGLAEKKRDLNAMWTLQKDIMSLWESLHAKGSTGEQQSR